MFNLLKPRTVCVINLLCILSGNVISINAYTCVVVRELNQQNKWKWVIPYPDLCQCTKMIMGGVNTWTPIRPFMPTYVDSPLFSDDVEAIRRHYDLICRKETETFSGSSSLSSPFPNESSEDGSPTTDKSRSSDISNTDISPSTEASTSTEPSTYTNVNEITNLSLSIDMSTHADTSLGANATSNTEISPSSNLSTHTDTSSSAHSTSNNNLSPSTDVSINTNLPSGFNITDIPLVTNAIIRSNISTSTNVSTHSDISTSSDVTTHTKTSSSTDLFTHNDSSTSADITNNTDISPSTDVSTLSNISPSADKSTNTDLSYRTNVSTSKESTTEPSASWSEWSEWSLCSKGCGIGTTTRSRTCESQKTSLCQGVTREDSEKSCVYRNWCVATGRCGPRFRADNGLPGKCIGSCCSTNGWCGVKNTHCVLQLYSDNRCCTGLTCPTC